MRYIAFLLLFTTSTLVKAQFLGNTKESVINYLNSNPNYFNIDFHYDNKSFAYYITYECKDSEIIIVSCFFSENNICTQRSICYSYNSLNNIVSTMNENFVKSTDNTLSWTDYQKDITVHYIIQKFDETFNLVSY